MWSALDLFEEAADLGVAAAQENAAYLLEQLAPAECLALQEGLAEKTVDSAAVQAASDAVRDSGTVQDHCEAYMHRLATHRWAQLAGAGEPRAMRKVAATLLDPQLQLQLQLGSEASARDAATLFALAGEQGDTESLLRLGWMLYEGSHGEGCRHGRSCFAPVRQLQTYFCHHCMFLCLSSRCCSEQNRSPRAVQRRTAAGGGSGRYLGRIDGSAGRAGCGRWGGI